jgi:serine/threonine-protein kinase TTK/MPS1
MDDYEHYEIPETVARNTAAPAAYSSVSRHTSAKGRLDENGNPQSSMRIKRAGKIPGTFLSGPARRGRRRQSDEDVEGEGEMDQYNPHQEPDQDQDLPMDDVPDIAYYPDGNITLAWSPAPDLGDPRRVDLTLNQSHSDMHP